VIDTTTNKVVTTLDVGLAPAGVAVTPDGSKVYVANRAANGTVSVIDTATNAVSATVAVGSNPVGVAFTPDGSKAYVANQFDHTVSVIATASNTVVATIHWRCWQAGSPRRRTASNSAGQHCRRRSAGKHSKPREPHRNGRRFVRMLGLTSAGSVEEDTWRI
jgi:YVTN family beta-propeller protein